MYVSVHVHGVPIAISKAPVGMSLNSHDKRINPSLKFVDVMSGVGSVSKSITLANKSPGNSEINHSTNQYSHFNSLTSTLSLQHSHFNFQTSSLSLQISNFNTLTSTLSLQHSHFNILTASLSVTHSHFNTLTSTLSLQHCQLPTLTSTLSQSLNQSIVVQDKSLFHLGKFCHFNLPS